MLKISRYGNYKDYGRVLSKVNKNTSYKYVFELFNTPSEVRGDAVGCGTTQRAGRSRVRFPKGVIGIFY
jgi:hypothetical protein